jgi:energy-coupling factor transporter ATP-binding protein EcfA2
LDGIILTLLGYPLSIFSNVTYEALKEVHKNLKSVKLDDIFVECFLKSMKMNEQGHDKYARQVLQELATYIKKDRSSLIIIFSEVAEGIEGFLPSLRHNNFKAIVAEQIINKYMPNKSNLEIKSLLVGIVDDCFDFYTKIFFETANEKLGLLFIFNQVLKIDDILESLNKINSEIVSKKEFEEFRNLIFKSFYEINKDYSEALNAYDQYIKNKFQYLELRGFSPKIQGREISMKLSEVFVNLMVHKEIDFSIPNIEIKIKKGPINKPNTQANLLPFEETNSVILGDPGAGKSTLLKYLALNIVNDRTTENILNSIIPIFIRISEYSDYYRQNKTTLYEYIIEHLDLQYKSLFKMCFEYNNVILLIDGLDEVIDTPLRNIVTHQINDLVARYPNNKYIVTSRIVGYQDSKLGGRFSHYVLEKFSLDDVNIFGKQWYKAIAENTDKDYAKAERLAQNLFSSISRNQSVIRLATNPLLMTIIAMINHTGKKIPNKRVELYEVATETFLENWVQLRIESDSQLKDKDEIIDIFAPIAFEIHNKNSDGLIEEEELQKAFILNFLEIYPSFNIREVKREFKSFLAFLRKESGFFYEKGQDDSGNTYFGFIHLTFQEYLSAIEIMNRWEQNELELRDFVFDARWTEVIRLAAAQLRSKGRAGRSKVTKFIKAILLVVDPFPEANRPLQLACLILSDDVDVNGDFVGEILDLIINVLGSWDLESLTKSFCGLIHELQYSEFKNCLNERLSLELSTDNSVLHQNILRVLDYNLSDNDIEKVAKIYLNSNLNSETVASLFDISCSLIKDHNFINENIFLEINAYLYTLNNACEDRLFEKKAKKYIHAIRDDNIDFEDYSWVTKILDFNPFFIEHINYVIDPLLDSAFCDLGNESGKYHSIFEGLPISLQKYIENELIENLIKALSDISIEKFRLRHYNSREFDRFYFCGYFVHITKMNNYDGDIDYSIWLWDPKYTKFINHCFSQKNAINYLDSITDETDAEIKNICESAFYYASGPVADIVTSYKMFNHLLEVGIFDIQKQPFGPHQRWLSYPLEHIEYDNDKLSTFILLKGSEYATRSSRLEYIDKIDLKLKFINENIHAPVRLLFNYIIGLETNDVLVAESLEFLKNTDDKLKDGSFSILYKILNPFKLVGQ